MAATHDAAAELAADPDRCLLDAGNDDDAFGAIRGFSGMPLSGRSRRARTTSAADCNRFRLLPSIAAAAAPDHGEARQKHEDELMFHLPMSHD